VRSTDGVNAPVQSRRLRGDLDGAAVSREIVGERQELEPAHGGMWMVRYAGDIQAYAADPGQPDASAVQTNRNSGESACHRRCISPHPVDRALDVGTVFGFVETTG
jgi:hypothetical protein